MRGLLLMRLPSRYPLPNPFDAAYAVGIVYGALCPDPAILPTLMPLIRSRGSRGMVPSSRSWGGPLSFPLGPECLLSSALLARLSCTLTMPCERSKPAR